MKKKFSSPKNEARVFLEKKFALFEAFAWSNCWSKIHSLNLSEYVTQFVFFYQNSSLFSYSIYFFLISYFFYILYISMSFHFLPENVADTLSSRFRKWRRLALPEKQRNFRTSAKVSSTVPNFTRSILQGWPSSGCGYPTTKSAAALVIQPNTVFECISNQCNSNHQ